MMPDTDERDLSMTSEVGEEGVVDLDDMTPLLNMQTEDNTQDEYFTSYEDVEIHRLMVNDKPRTQAYADAISKNKHLFEGKIAMDIGAGTGILSLFMAAAGAKKVYAVEASGMAEVIQGVARDNGYEEVIQVFHSKVEDILLPENEKVDIIVSEWMGFYLLHESMLNSVIKARDKHLAEDGTIFPSQARIYASPCSLTNLYKEQINFWDNVYGFNMTAVKNYALKSKMTKPEVCMIPEQNLLAEPRCVKDFNLKWVTEEEVKHFAETVFVAITRPGMYQGLCLWFECDFDGTDYDEDGREFGTVVTLSTSPSSPPTHWKQTVVVLGNEVSLSNQETELRCLEDDNNDNGSHSNLGLDGGSSSSNGTGSASNDQKDKKESITGNMDTESPTHHSGKQSKYFEVEKDEVVGWRLIFAQSDDNVRHYTMTVEMLDPETEEHPIPCACPMPRCLIIAKMIEEEECRDEEEGIIDCT